MCYYPSFLCCEYGWCNRSVSWTSPWIQWLHTCHGWIDLSTGDWLLVTPLLASLWYIPLTYHYNGSIYLQKSTTATTAEKTSSNDHNHNMTPVVASPSPTTAPPSTPSPPPPTSTPPSIIPSPTLFFSSLGACVHRTAVALVCLLLYLALAVKCPIARHRDAHWQTHTPAWWRLVYIWVSFLGTTPSDDLPL